MTYAIMNFDGIEREENPLTGAGTDRSARIKAKQYAKKYDIKKYAIIFYRKSDGCRGEIEI